MSYKTQTTAELTTVAVAVYDRASTAKAFRPSVLLINSFHLLKP